MEVAAYNDDDGGGGCGGCSFFRPVKRVVVVWFAGWYMMMMMTWPSTYPRSLLTNYRSLLSTVDWLEFYRKIRRIGVFTTVYIYTYKWSNESQNFIIAVLLVGTQLYNGSHLHMIWSNYVYRCYTTCDVHFRPFIKKEKRNAPRRGIEPRSPAWQAGILATILSRIWYSWSENNNIQMLL